MLKAIEATLYPSDFLLSSTFRCGHCIQNRFLKSGALPSAPLGLVLEEEEWHPPLLFRMREEALCRLMRTVTAGGWL